MPPAGKRIDRRHGACEQGHGTTTQARTAEQPLLQQLRDLLDGQRVAGVGLRGCHGNG